VLKISGGEVISFDVVYRGKSPDTTIPATIVPIQRPDLPQVKRVNAAVQHAEADVFSSAAGLRTADWDASCHSIRP
jgi:hypothetical protein